jgi:hypothetical protein
MVPVPEYPLYSATLGEYNMQKVKFEGIFFHLLK